VNAEMVSGFPVPLYSFPWRAARQRFYAFVLSVPSLFGFRVKLGFPLDVNWRNRDTFYRGKNICSLFNSKKVFPGKYIKPGSLLGNMLS